MKLVKSFSVDAPPERVAQALCSEAFNVAAETDREEVVSARVVAIQELPESRVFEVRSTEYKRTRLGRIDRSGTVESVTRHTYDPRVMTLSWDYRGAGSRWVTVAGVYRLSPSADGTRVVHDITIDVHVPLLGEKIAKLIAREFDEAAGRFERLLRRYAKESPGVDHPPAT
jgi:carbon monoxide dehydrogenase subunit G